VSNTAKIKLTDQDNESVVYAVSPAVFAIIGVFDITHPENGDVLTAKDAYTIEWTKKGTGISNIVLQYSTDGGTNWNYVNAVSPYTITNSGTYNWASVPEDVLSTDCKLKITDPNNSNAVNIGVGQFRIKGSLTITSPTIGTESWGAGTDHDITWTKKGNITSVMIDYSADAGTNYTNVVSGVGGSALSYTWAIPAEVTLTTTGRIKITSESESDVYSVSTNNFEVKGNLVLNTPSAAGVSLAVGDAYDITWTKYGAISYVNVYLMTNGSSYGSTAIATVAAVNQTYSWTIPDSISKTCKIKVQDQNNATVYDESDNYFEIKGKVVLNVPNGGEKWFYNEAAQIRWTPTGTYTQIKIDYSTDDFATFTNIDTVDAGGTGVQQTYNWSSVTIPVSESAKIRVMDPNSTTVQDISASAFSVRGRLTLLVPNGTESWVVNSSHAITWNTKGNIPYVDLSYSTDGTNYTSIATNVANSGTYSWTVPNAISDNVTVKIADTRYPADTDVDDVSDASFKIIAGISLTAPVGGEDWGVGTVQAIKWTANGTIPTVAIYYSDDSGTNYSYTVSSSTDGGAGTYSWTVPNNPKTTCKVKVADTRKEDTVYAVSPENFSIIGSITITAPLSGAEWPVGQQKEITWAQNGNIAQCKILLSRDSGASWTQITDTASGGSYFWDIPESYCSPTARIKIIDYSNPRVYDQLASDFKLQAQFTFTSPLAGEVYTVANTCSIAWTNVGVVPNVYLEYSSNGGTTYSAIETVGNSGSYSWSVPDAISSSVVVRISDTRDPSANTVSGMFRIRGALSLTSPKTGDVWTAENPVTVTWTRTGSISTVSLDYSSDSGANYTTNIASGVTASLGTYGWTAPAQVTSTARVKVSDTSNSTVLSASGDFYVRGSIIVTSPNSSSDQWEAGTSHNITWNRTGDFPNVIITLSVNSGASYPTTIVSSTGASAKTYAWAISDSFDLATTYRVKIADAADPTNVFDISDADFSIIGSLVLVTPNVGATWYVGTTQNVVWTKHGNIAYIAIDLSTNSFSDESATHVITAQTDANGTPSGSYSYPWSVGDYIGNTLKIRIKDYSNPDNVKAVSSVAFTIKGVLLMTSPNGGESWVVGDAHNITWTPTGTINYVRLDYSTDGGNTYTNAITSRTSGTAGTYAWAVADAIGTNLKVRVSDYTDSDVSDASDAVFTVKGSIKVTSPNGGESWGVGTSHAITWTRTGSFANVKIEYSTDGGSNYSNTLTVSTDASTGTYTWSSIPDVISSQVKVRVTDTSDSSVTDASDTNFKIVGILAVSSPNTAVRWTVGETHNITWTRTGTIANVKLEYSTDGGSNYTTIVSSTAGGALSLSWTVPDAISQTCRVRISDASDAEVYDVSDVNFIIQAGFAITSPNGGEVWSVGSAHNITWTYVGTTSTVKLEYTIDGTNYNPITSSTLNNGTYGWTAADAISTTVKVRISDYNDPLAYDVSDAYFKIRGAITVTSPNGGEAWVVGSAHNITWTTQGTFSGVDISYSTDNGENYSNIIATAVSPTSNIYSWTIPDNLSKTCMLKISDSSDSTAYDTSDSVFKIRGDFTVLSPNGGEIWDVSSIHNVTWNFTGSIASAKIDYSLDNGNNYSYSVISSTDASVLSYPWVVPDAISTQARIRVADASDPTVYDVSNASFKIRGALTISSPNGGEEWVVASSHAVTWTYSGTMGNVGLTYSTDGGTNFTGTIVVATPVSDRSYTWNSVPDAISSSVVVKITNLADTSVYDVSDAAFRIKGALALVSPNGGEVWSVGSTEAVSWTRTGSVANVMLEYSSDGGASYPGVITGSTLGSAGSYSWLIPDVIGSTMRVKISDVSDSTVYDVSDANFKIRGALTLTAPNGGEIWLINSNNNITWTRYGSIINAKLEYSTDGGTNFSATIVGSTPAVNQIYAWSIPDVPSTTMRVKISDASDSTVYDISNANFTLRGGFAITSPNGGESWLVGSIQNVTWTTYGSYTSVNLSYSTDSGSTWNLIYGGLTNVGSYAWTIPDAIFATCKVKITATSDTEATDSSDAVFKIHGGLVITAPNGGEEWGVATSHNITWARTGSVATVKLEYSTDSFSDESATVLISNNVTAANLSYSWTVPDIIGSNNKVRISVSTDSAVYDVSDSPFTVRGTLAVTSPNGGESWIVSSAHPVTWTTSGTIASVKLDYSIDGGSTYSNIISSTANSNTYTWTVPDAISTACKIKVSNAADTNSYDVSDNNFKIRGNLTLTSPNGGEKWAIGTTQVIRWDRTGSIANVRLEYSDDGGTVYVPIISSTANAGSYSWSVPDAITVQALVKIYDASDLTVYDTSDAVFKIQGYFKVTSPNGGEAWQAASTQTISWTYNGTISYVNLYYSKDSGSTWTTIALSVANAGSYSWAIPVEAVSITCRVKVASASDPEAMDISDADFRVRCAFTITYPNGGEQLRVGRSYNIRWNKVGTPAAVKLEYSPDSFLDPSNTAVIDGNASSASPYAWTVPDYLCETTKIRISDAADTGANDVSDAAFRITGDVTVTSPNGGESWAYNSTQAITWTSAGTISSVKIEYSVDGGASYSILKAVANNGSYNWNIPDQVSDSCMIRISDASDSTAYDVSDAVFNIVPVYTLSSPNGGEIWTVGETHSITWGTLGTVSYVRLDYSTDSGATYGNAIIASISNSGNYNWSVPDAISTRVRVRVGSAVSPAAYDASDADFKIRGKFAVTAPNGGENLQISQNIAVNWITTGTINNVQILYSIDSGATFPGVVVGSAANVNTYLWTIPDNRSPNARVRVISTADNTVYDDSDADFRIQGYLGITSPAGGEVWLSGDTHAIAWSWGGTMPNVKLSYSTDSGATYPYVINASAANGAGGSGTYSYAWVIPDTLSHTCRVKVEDTDDPTVYSASSSDFRITGSITITAPAGGERWVTNESHNIVWTNKGSIPEVKIVYSKDDFSSAPGIIAASVANANTYAWTIPDDRSTTVKVRVLDAADETIYGTCAAVFTIDYYNITWDVRDLLTNERLTNLSVTETNSDGVTIDWQASALTSPVTHATPYGTWTTVWTSSGYGDKGQNFTADGDKSFTIYLETSAVHIWESDAVFTYDAVNDKLKVTAWLQRDGSVVTGASKVGIYIYDESGNIMTYNSTCDSEYYNYDSNGDGEADRCSPRPTLYSSSIDSSGYFFLTLPAPTGLASGVAYAAVVNITNASGAHFKTPTSFSITEAAALNETVSAIDTLSTVTLPTFQSSVQNTLNQGIAEQKQMITDIMVGTGGDATTIMNSGGMVGMIQSSLTSFETKTNEAITKLQSGAETAVAAGQELEATSKKFSWKASVSPTTALVGDTITIQVQGQANLLPLLSVYNSNDKAVVSSTLMTESRAGFYTYSFPASTANFIAGKAYTFLVTENTTGGMVSGSGMIESMGITTVAGLAAAAPEAERAAKKALDAIKAVESVLVSKENINIAVTLKNLKQSVDELPSTLSKEGGNTQVLSAINDISNRLTKIMGSEGMDFGTLLDEKLGNSSSMKQLRNKTDTISSVVDLLLQIMESKLGGVDTPIVSTSLQSGSVKFRIMAINPSRTKVQKVQVKKYLPEEVKPKDIMDLGGLDLEYDSEKGIYYVYKDDFELQPNQVNVFEVEVEDIWMISDAQIADLKKRTTDTLALFEKTSLYPKAKEVADTIYPVLEEMPRSQSDDTISREQHIGIYRQNTQNIKVINEKLDSLEKMLAPEKGKPTPDVLEKSKLKINMPTKSTTWLIILVVVVFLGLFAGIFFFVWQSQIRSSQDLIKDSAKNAFPGGQKPEEKTNPPPPK